MLAGALAAPPQAGSAGAADPQVASAPSAEALYDAGEQAFGLGDFDRAIENFEAAYAASKLIAILYNVGLAYMRRFEISAERKDLLRARAVLRNYVLGLESDPSLGQPDDGKKLLAEIEELLGSSPTPQDPPKDSTARRQSGLKIGLGTVGALAGVSLIVGLTTGATVTRQPFQGSRYKAIYEAAEQNDVLNGPNDDMCALGRDVRPVADACSRRDTMRNVSIAMLVVSGLLGATAVALGVLHARRMKLARVSLSIDHTGVFIGAVGRF